MNWRDFWNGDHAIYVSPRHKLLHARLIGRALVGLVPHRQAHVLDHGCGEAIHADALADACSVLWLCESALTLRAQLTARFINRPSICIIAPETAEIGIPDDSLDLVTFISVSQYLSRDEMNAALALWLAKLKPGGILVVGDIIPPDVGMVTDTMALLRFAWQGGFLWAALGGLVKTAFSDYRQIREKLGLTMYTSAEIDTMLHKAGFAAVRQRDNIGHNPARMTMVAQKRV